MIKLPLRLFFLIICTSLFAHTVTKEYAAHEQLPIVVLITSYNNELWVEKNLDSVFMQHYDNFRVVYIDDGSQDKTAQHVQEYINTRDAHQRITLIVNSERCRKMKNLYNGVHYYCDDFEIVVQLDGDDWFIDKNLFAQLNELYSTKNIWLTYGSDSLLYAQSTDKHTIESGSYRSQHWVYAPTRTFYAWLFKAIKLQDFIAEQVQGFQGLFFPAADDLAFMFPMLEMAGNRFHYICDINYKVNTHNPINTKKVEYDLQEASSQDIRVRAHYAQLAAPVHVDTQNSIADVVIISDDTNKLQALLSSLDTYVQEKGDVTIVYKSQQNNHETFLNTLPYRGIDGTRTDLSYLLQELARELPCDHVLMMHTNIQVTQHVNLKAAIKILEETGAYACYFAYVKDLFSCPTQHIIDDVYAWKFNCGEYAFFENRDMTLIRKKDMLNNAVDLHAIGIFFRESAVGGKITKSTVPLERPAILTPPLKKVKKRRLHVPGDKPLIQKNYE